MTGGAAGAVVVDCVDAPPLDGVPQAGGSLGFLRGAGRAALGWVAVPVSAAYGFGADQLVGSVPPWLPRPAPG